MLCASSCVLALSDKTWAISAIVYPLEPGPGTAGPRLECLATKVVRCRCNVQRVYVFQCSLHLEVGLRPVAPNATTSTSRFECESGLYQKGMIVGISSLVP